MAYSLLSFPQPRMVTRMGSKSVELKLVENNPFINRQRAPIDILEKWFFFLNNEHINMELIKIKQMEFRAIHKIRPNKQPTTAYTYNK